MSAIQAPLSNSLPLPESAGSSHATPSGRPRPEATAAKVGHDFESVFASTMLKQMRQSLEPGSMFGQDSGDVYGGLFDRFMGDQLTKGQGLGLARMIEASIEKMQRAGSHASPPVQGANPDMTASATDAANSLAITG